MLWKESQGTTSSKSFQELYEEVNLPKMYKTRQVFNKEAISPVDIPSLVKEQLKPFLRQIKPNMKIAITCGSRGIANIDIITKGIVEAVKYYGGLPFVVPAMGSHGGATSKGQIEVLNGYGIREDWLDCPIISSMETVYLGKTDDGIDVYMDKNAYGADGIIVCGRIKAHTSFRYKYESGLMKMLSVGLGKQKGAETIHKKGLESIPIRMESCSNYILKKANIICGLGIIENAYKQTYRLVGVRGDDIPAREPELLLEAQKKRGKIYFNNIDVLIVGEMGKDFSGDGMDSNVIGRFPSPAIKGDINIQHIVVLDLSDESQGNGNGIGLADVTTKKLISKLKPEPTYANSITSTCLNAVKLPIIANNPREAVQIALKTCVNINFDQPRVIYIDNTLDLETIYISEGIKAEALGMNNVTIESLDGQNIFNQEGEIEIK